jgi:hypothetical protein
MDLPTSCILCALSCVPVLCWLRTLADVTAPCAMRRRVRRDPESGEALPHLLFSHNTASVFMDTPNRWGVDRNVELQDGAALDYLGRPSAADDGSCASAKRGIYNILYTGHTNPSNKSMAHVVHGSHRPPSSAGNVQGSCMVGPTKGCTGSGQRGPRAPEFSRSRRGRGEDRNHHP